MMSEDDKNAPQTVSEAPAEAPPEAAKKPDGKPVEIGGPEGPEPTRFGDWERNGRCYDF